MTAEILARIVARIWITPDGCWEWLGSRKPNGYGEIRAGGRLQYVHRVVYMEVRGPIPQGLDLDHLCRNRACCNPIHLEAVDRTTNILRGLNPDVQRRRFAAITHCPQNHPYDEVNTYRRKTGTRQCKECTRQRNRARRAARRAAA